MLYRTYIESPDVANMIGIYPKTDSSHGYGNPRTSLYIESPMRCIVIFRRTVSIVTVPLVCGWRISHYFISSMKCMHISCPGIGIRQPHARMDSSSVFGFEMRWRLLILRRVLATSLWSGVLVLIIPFT